MYNELTSQEEENFRKMFYSFVAYIKMNDDVEYDDEKKYIKWLCDKNNCKHI